MRILGIMDSHLSAAALIEDGHILAAVREEVLSRDKGYARFPARAVESVLKMAGVPGASVDAVAFGIIADTFDTPRFQVAERGLKRNAVSALALALPRGVLRSEALRRAWVSTIGAARRRALLAEQGPALAKLGLPMGALHFMAHHRCHAATAALLRPDPSQDGLIFVCDGYGDGRAGGIWRSRDGALTHLQAVPFPDSLGALYSRVTRLLGMKPWEHEYKVMGLAPYGEGPQGRAILDSLRGIYGVEGGRLTNRTRRTGIFLERALEGMIRGQRFDAVAWALQTLTEETLSAWVAHHVRAEGIGDVALAGGVFLNVKANQRIAALPGVRSVFIMPPAGDDSAAIGAALALWMDSIGPAAALRQAIPLPHLFLGPDIDADLDAALQDHGDAGWDVRRCDDIDRAVADLLAAGHIVARCEGRAEFGPRALGHRSILCPAHDLALARRLNLQIKERDFWMPFAATILDTFASAYLSAPGDHPAPFMIRTFDTTPAGRDALAAALHPADGTTRPQVLRPEDAPRYHRLLSLYAALTGRGALLNTSFNRHGEPMVATARDALRTFAGSGLTHLALGDWLIVKGA